MWHVCCLHSAEAVSTAISPTAAHNTTDLVNHTTTILYRGTNLYLQKFWPEIPKLLHIQICFLVQDCHKTSCIMRCNGGNVKQDSPCSVQATHNWLMIAFITWNSEITYVRETWPWLISVRFDSCQPVANLHPTKLHARTFSKERLKIMTAHRESKSKKVQANKASSEATRLFLIK